MKKLKMSFLSFRNIIFQVSTIKLKYIIKYDIFLNVEIQTNMVSKNHPKLLTSQVLVTR